MKKTINIAQQFALRFMLVGLMMATTFSIAEAQHHGGGGGGGRSFGGGGGRSYSGGGGRSFGGNPGISSAPRGGGGFSGSGRVAAAPHFAPSVRVYAGVTGRVGYGPGYNTYRGGNFGRPYYYGGVYGRPYFGGYGAYYRGYYPHIGFSISVLPFGYYPFYFGGYPYYYNEGLFYRQYNDNYQVVAPPMGAEVPRLPRGAQDITIDGQQYFEKDGVYYQPIVNENGKKVYRVAGKDGVLNTDGQQNDQQQNVQPQNVQPQNNNNQQQYNNNTLPRVGDVVNSIPSESRPVIINGEKLFISADGVYYQEDNSGNTRIYKVVGVPSTDDGTDTVANP